MESDEYRLLLKVSYEKPVAVDLGGAAPVLGASCATGTNYEEPNWDCDQVGNSAEGDCTNAGNSAAWCETAGNSASSRCFAGSLGESPP